MQQTTKVQFKHRSKFNQLILLDFQEQIVSSCDSIFSTVPFHDKPVTEWFPFMEIIYSSIWETVSETSNMTFNRMETPIPNLPGIYDFSFSKVKIDNRDLLLWSIYDYTDLYEDYKQFQQRKNELEIHRETLEFRHQSLQSKEDVKIQQNIVIESLDHLQLTYFNNIKSALLAPVNILDGITHLMTGTLPTKNTQYIPQLRLILKQLNSILDEFQTVNDQNTPDLINQPFNLNTLCEEISLLIQQKNTGAKLAFSVDKTIPEILRGNFLYLKQTLQGIIMNGINLHPDSSFDLNISLASAQTNTVKIHFELTEFLNKKTILLTKQDYIDMVYRLSIVKQLIELQKGNINIGKNPKDLSITISFDLSFIG